MPDGRLDTWKEISEYLGIGIRTLQRWEKEQGLPAYRLGDKGHVYSYREELDQWMKVKGKKIAAEEALTGEIAPKEIDVAVEGRRWFPSKLVWIVPILIFAAAVGLAVNRGLFFSSPQPVSAAIQNNNRLVVLDGKGEVLWTKQFAEVLAFSGGPGTDGLWEIVDLDGDGKNEVLFTPKPSVFDPRQKEKLLCFSNKGDLRWEYAPGIPVEWGGFRFPDHYRLWEFGVHELRHDGRRFTVVVANMATHSPSQVSILDPDGKLVGEYWNTGYIFDHEVVDIDKDGQDEVIVGGVNDFCDSGRAFLAVIASEGLRRICPVPPGYAPSFKAGGELRYILLPQTDTSKVMALDSRVEKLAWQEGNRLSVTVHTASHPDGLERVYYLETDLHVIRLDFPQTFLSLHRQLERERALDHSLNEAEKQQLARLEVLSAAPTCR